MLSLPQNEIHLWHANQAEFDGPELESNCLSWLTESETKRYHRYTYDYHRKQFLLGRMLIRNSLSKYAEIEPQDWKFEENEYGKPKDKDWYFTNKELFNGADNIKDAFISNPIFIR